MHDKIMNTSESETYFGDVICVSGSNKKNIETRRNQAIGSVSQIMSMIVQISLGHYYFEVGWYGVTKDQYRKLEQVDEMLLMNLFQVPKSVPRLSLYIECAKLPVRFVCQARRLLYNWHILHVEESELLFKFYSAQQLKPGKNDWVRQIEKDKNELNISLSDQEVKKMTKLKFKQIVMQKINVLAAKHFTEIQSKQQKTKHLKMTFNSIKYSRSALALKT